MELLRPGPALPELEQLIGTDWPTLPRCWGVLDGSLSGSIWVDRWPDPAWVAVTELADGTTYLGGHPPADALVDLFGRLQPASGEIIVGLRSDDDPLFGRLPPAPDYDGHAIDFTDRHEPGAAAGNAAELPAGYRIVPMNVELFRRAEWFADTLAAFGSLERWQATGLGSTVLYGNLSVAEALAGPPARGTMEMGIITRPEHRRRGLATAAARHLARTCEARGYEVWWNANADNLPSVAIARRIGFTRERRYRLQLWRADRFTRSG